MQLAATQLARSDLRPVRRSNPQGGQARWEPICFRIGPPLAVEPRYEAARLSAGSASALAELLQVLSCGEESAALTFDHLGRSCQERSMHSALTGNIQALTVIGVKHNGLTMHYAASTAPPLALRCQT